MLDGVSQGAVKNSALNIGNITGSPFDSSGNFIESRTLIYDEEDEMVFAYFAAEEVAKMDEAWDWDGPAFQGVVEVGGLDQLRPGALEAVVVQESRSHRARWQRCV